jgi:hypothetical protein
VTDYDNNRIQVLDSEGNFIRMIGGGKGTNPGQLNQPICVCIDDETGYLYVADYSNNRIQIFNKDTGEYLTQLNGQPNGVDSLSGPRGLCIASNYLFISDRENHRIQIFDKIKLEFIRHLGLGGAGSLVGQFNRPMELCANVEDGTLIIVDGYNHRVQIMEISELQPQKMIARKKLRIKQRAESRARSLIAASKLAVTMPLQNLRYQTETDQLHTISCSNLGSLYSFTMREAMLSSSKLQPMSAKLTSLREEASAESIQNTQALSMISLIRETAKFHRTSPSQFVPVIIAFDHLIKRHWSPFNVDDDILEILIDVLAIIDCENVGDDDYKDIFRSIVNLLLVISKSNKQYALKIFRLSSIALKRKCDLSIQYCDLDDIWHGLAYLIAECLNILITSASSSTGESKESLSFYREIFKFMFGSKVSRVIAGRPSIDSIRSPAASPSATPRRGLSKSSDVSVSMQDDISDKFRSVICGLLDITNIVVDSRLEHDLFEYTSSSSSSHNERLIEEFIRYFQVCNDASSAQNGLQRRDLYRGQRHIWQENEAFQVGDLLDCMDKERSWFESYITDVLPDSGGIVVHFLGWGSKWDDLVTLEEIPIRVAPLNTKTKNWRAELFEGGLIEIKCNEDTVNQKWMWGKVLALNVEEEWVDVAYAFGSDATINKRLHLYGENICPIGMHTKEKSKVAAAAVIKPAKKIEESIKARLESSHAGDTCFLDAEDDFVESYPAHLSLSSAAYLKIDSASLSYPLNPDNMFLAAGLEYIAITVFKEIIKELVDSIEFPCSESVSALSSSNADVSKTPKLLLSVIVDSPFRHLMGAFIIRPFLVRCGLRAKVFSDTIFSSIASSSSTATISFERLFELVDTIDRYSKRCVATLRSTFSDVLESQIIDKLVNKLNATILRCAMMNVFEMITAEHPVIDLKSLFKTHLLSNNRFTEDVKSLRKVLKYTFSMASYDQLRRLQNLWMESISENVQEGCLGEYDSYIQAHNIDRTLIEIGLEEANGLWESVLTRLVTTSQLCRHVTQTEFKDLQINQISIDRGISAGCENLPARVTHGVLKALAHRISSILELEHSNTNPSLSIHERVKSLEVLKNFSKILPSSSVTDSLHHYYALYLSNRLLHGKFVSINLEQTALSTFQFGSKAAAILNDYCSAHALDSLFQKQIISINSHMSSSHQASQMMVSNNFSVKTLSQSLWPSHSLQYSDLILPPVMCELQSQYQDFYCSKCPSRALNWYLGYGKVEVHCSIPRCKYDLILECNEAQATVLLAFQHQSSILMSELRTKTGLSQDELSVLVSSLSSSSLPLLSRSSSPLDRVHLSDEVVSSDFLDFINDELIVKRSKKNVILAIPSGSSDNAVSTSTDTHFHDAMANLVDAAIVRVLKRAAQTKSPVDAEIISPTSSPYMTSDKLFHAVCQEVQKRHSIERLATYSLIRSRCSALVSANIIDCFAIKRLQDDLGGHFTIPSESNYLYSYIPVTHASIVDNSAASAPISVEASIPSSGSTSATSAFNQLVEIVHTHNRPLGMQSAIQQRSILDTSAANESKDHTENLSTESPFYSSDALPGSEPTISIDLFTEALLRVGLATSSEAKISAQQQIHDILLMNKNTEKIIREVMMTSFDKVVTALAKDMSSLIYQHDLNTYPSMDKLALIEQKRLYAKFTRVLSSLFRDSNALKESSSSDDSLDFYLLLSESAQQHIDSLFGSLCIMSERTYQQSSDLKIAWMQERQVSSIGLLKMLQPLLSRDRLTTLATTLQVPLTVIISDISPSAASTVSHDGDRQADLASFETLDHSYSDSPKLVDDEECKDSHNASRIMSQYSLPSPSAMLNQRELASLGAGGHQIMSLRVFTMIIVWCQLQGGNGSIVQANPNPSTLSFGSQSHNPPQQQEVVTFGRVSPAAQPANSSSKDRKKRRNKGSHHQTIPSQAITFSCDHGQVKQESNPHSFTSVGIPTSAGKRIQLESSLPTASYSTAFTGHTNAFAMLSSPESSPSSLHAKDSPSFTSPEKLPPSSFFNDVKLPLPPPCHDLVSSPEVTSSSVFHFNPVSPSAAEVANVYHNWIDLYSLISGVEDFVHKLHDHNDIAENLSASSNYLSSSQVWKYLQVVDGHMKRLLSGNVQIAELTSSSSLDWLSSWDLTMSSLIRKCFTILDSNGDSFITIDDFQRQLDRSVSGSLTKRLPSNSISEQNSSIHGTSPLKRGSSKEIHRASLSRQTSKSTSSQAIRAFFNQYRTQISMVTQSAEHVKIVLLSKTQQIVEICNDIEPEIAMELLPYFHWDVRLVIDAYYDSDSTHSQLNFRKLVEVLSLASVVSTNASSPAITCLQCQTSAPGEYASATCNSHYYCKSCWGQELEASSHHDTSAIRCPKSCDARNPCFGHVTGEIVEMCYDREHRIKFIHQRFEYLSKKLRHHLVSLEESSCSSLAMLNGPGHRCSHCKRLRHYPVSCHAIASYVQELSSSQESSSATADAPSSANRLYRKANTMNTICYYKYLEFSNYSSTAQQALTYYQELVDLSISPMDYHSMQPWMQSQVFVHMQNLSRAWQIIWNGYSLLAHVEVLKKHMKISSESVNIILEIFEERLKVCFEHFKDIWIKLSIKSLDKDSLARNDELISGLEVVNRVVVKELDRIAARGIEDSRYRLSDNLFGRKIDSCSRQRNLLNDMLLGEWDDNISLPLSFISWSTAEEDIRELMMAMDHHPASPSADATAIESAEDWDVSTHRIGGYTASNRMVMSQVMVPGLFVDPLAMSAPYPGSSIRSRSSSLALPMPSSLGLGYSSGRNSIYLIQQRLYLINKSLSYLASAPFTSRSSVLVNHAVYVLKYLIVFFHWTSAAFHPSLQQSRSSETASFYENNSVIVDRVHDILLDLNIYKSIVAILISWGSECFELEMICYYALMTGLECIDGLSVVLISIPGFETAIASQDKDKDHTMLSSWQSQSRDKMVAKLMLSWILDAQQRSKSLLQVPAAHPSPLIWPEKYLPRGLQQLMSFVASLEDDLVLVTSTDSLLIRVGVRRFIALEELLTWILASLSGNSSLEIDIATSIASKAMTFYSKIAARFDGRPQSAYRDSIVKLLSQLVLDLVASFVDETVMPELEALINAVLDPAKVDMDEKVTKEFVGAVCIKAIAYHTNTGSSSTIMMGMVDVLRALSHAKDEDMTWTKMMEILSTSNTADSLQHLITFCQQIDS